MCKELAQKCMDGVKQQWNWMTAPQRGIATLSGHLRLNESQEYKQDSG